MRLVMVLTVCYNKTSIDYIDWENGELCVENATQAGIR